MKKGIIVLICLICSTVTYYAGLKARPLEKQTDTVYVVYDILSDPEQVLLGTPKEHLYETLQFYGIKHPEIVYAIAVLETGNFTSELCTKYNNLFGLYDSAKKRYRHFDNWYESVIAYRDLVESKYNEDENYYRFLANLPYATDPNYIAKLKKIVTKIRKEKNEGN